MNKPSRALLPLVPIVLGLAGCDTILPPPKLEPIPKKEVLPKAEVFAPADYVIKGTRLPSDFRVVSAPSGQLLTVQAVLKGKKGDQETVSFGTTETMRLAGIVTQTEGKPGYAQTIQTINNWTLNKIDIQIEYDPRVPWDSEGRRMVQVYFKPTSGPYMGQELNLNRMLVRSGYAVVDLNQATSVDLAGWLNDEVYARDHRTLDDRPDPLGLWKMGVILGDRPAPSYKATSKPAKSTAPTAVAGAPGLPAGGPTGPGGAPGLPGGPGGAPGLPGPPGRPGVPD